MARRSLAAHAGGTRRNKPSSEWRQFSELAELKSQRARPYTDRYLQYLPNGGRAGEKLRWAHIADGPGP